MFWCGSRCLAQCCEAWEVRAAVESLVKKRNWYCGFRLWELGVWRLERSPDFLGQSPKPSCFTRQTLASLVALSSCSGATECGVPLSSEPSLGTLKFRQEQRLEMGPRCRCHVRFRVASFLPKMPRRHVCGMLVCTVLLKCWPVASCEPSAKRCQAVVAATQTTAMDGGITAAIGSGRRQVLAGLCEAHRQRNNRCQWLIWASLFSPTLSRP